MRHAVANRKLGRNPGHRKALLRNMMNALVQSERIETTIAKAKEVRRLADRLITLGKKDTTHARRRAFSILSDKRNTEKIFASLASRFTGREGGYTRIVRTGYRSGDGAELAILEYLPAEEKKEKKEKTKKGKKKTSAASKAKPSSKTPEEGKPARTPRKTAAGKPPRAARKEAEGAAGEKKKPAGKSRKKKES